MKRKNTWRIRTNSANENIVRERRSQIVKSTVKLFAKRGIERISVREIAKACKMTSGNLYHYIGTKDDIILLAVQMYYAQLFNFIREANEFADVLEPREALERAIRQFYTQQDSERDSSYFVSRNFNSFGPAIKLQILESADNIAAVFEKIIRKGCASGVFRVEDPWMAAHTIRAIGPIWSTQHAVFTRRYTINQYIQRHLQQILDMLNYKAVGKANK